MTFTVSDMKAFNALVTASNNLNPEIVFHVEAGKLSVKTWAVHTASGLAFSIPIEGATTTDVFAVKTEDFLKAIKSIGDKATFHSDGSRLSITSGKKTHRLVIYDEENVKELPKLIPPGKVAFTFSPKEFADAIREATTYSNTLRFRAEEKTLTIKSVESGIQNDVEISLDINSDGRARCHYNGSFFSDIAGLAKLFDAAQLSFSDLYPFVVHYEQDGIIADFFVAHLVVDYD